MAQIQLDYLAPYVNVKSLIGLTQNPKVDVAATTGYKDWTLGASLGYDSLKSEVTGWSVIAGLFILQSCIFLHLCCAALCKPASKISCNWGVSLILSCAFTPCASRPLTVGRVSVVPSVSIAQGGAVGGENHQSILCIGAS